MLLEKFHVDVRADEDSDACETDVNDWVRDGADDAFAVHVEFLVDIEGRGTRCWCCCR